MQGVERHRFPALQKQIEHGLFDIERKFTVKRLIFRVKRGIMPSAREQLRVSKMLQDGAHRMLDLCLTVDPDSKKLITQQYVNLIEIHSDEIRVLEKRVADQER